MFSPQYNNIARAFSMTYATCDSLTRNSSASARPHLPPWFITNARYHTFYLFTPYAAFRALLLFGRVHLLCLYTIDTGMDVTGRR